MGAAENKCWLFSVTPIDQYGTKQTKNCTYIFSSPGNIPDKFPGISLILFSLKILNRMSELPSGILVPLNNRKM